jgi:hypothetical protein
VANSSLFAMRASRTTATADNEATSRPPPRSMRRSFRLLTTTSDLPSTVVPPSPMM